MQEDALWQAVLGEIELSVSRGNFVTWFKNTQLIKSKDDVLVVGVPNIFVKNQLERKFNDLVLEVLGKNGVSPERVEYKIHTGISPKRRAEEAILENPSNLRSANPPKARSSISKSSHSYRQGLNEKYTFESFVVGAGNELAHAACQAIALSPGTKYNPLFVYGGVGIGKTHLIQAVGNAVLASKSSAKVVYASTEQFVQEFVDAVRFKKNTGDFADFYRSADVLIVDDVQFLAGKERVQEEFFHTFNALYQANKQIIISSDKRPEDIPTLEDRLRSRFHQGSIQVVSAMFEGNRARPKHINARQIIERTAKHFHISIDDILGPKRDKDIVVPRQVAMYMLRSELHLSFPKIAHELGRKDHTTAIHSVDKIEKEMSYEGQIKKHVVELKERLYA
jgi:chromosomal replication initiator protein